MKDIWLRVKDNPALVTSLVGSVIVLVSLFTPISSEVQVAIVAVVASVVAVVIGAGTTANSSVAAKVDPVVDELVAGAAASQANGTPVNVVTNDDSVKIGEQLCECRCDVGVCLEDDCNCYCSDRAGDICFKEVSETEV